MKTILVLFALSVLSASAFASPMSPESLEIYKESATLALARGDVDSCSFWPHQPDSWGSLGTDGLTSIINEATSFEVNESGPQPVLIFRFEAGDLVRLTEITMSADFKTIKKVGFTQYTRLSKRVNIGTIIKPIFVMQDVQLNRVHAQCKGSS